MWFQKKLQVEQLKRGVCSIFTFMISQLCQGLFSHTVFNILIESSFGSFTGQSTAIWIYRVDFIYVRAIPPWSWINNTILWRNSAIAGSTDPCGWQTSRHWAMNYTQNSALRYNSSDRDLLWLRGYGTNRKTNAKPWFIWSRFAVKVSSTLALGL